MANSRKNPHLYPAAKSLGTLNSLHGSNVMDTIIQFVCSFSLIHSSLRDEVDYSIQPFV